VCGRFTIIDWQAVPPRFEIRNALHETRPRFNVAPSQLVVTVLAGPDGRELRRMRWGFTPNWAKPQAGRPPPINARAETLLERPMFREAVAKRRCLIPANGFYEWKTIPGERRKQPMYIRLKSGEIFGFAGLYTARRGDDGEWVESCAIVTTRPNELMADIHNRMPVILARADEALWLDRSITDTTAALPCLQPYPSELMEVFPVPAYVNNVHNDMPELIEPAAPLSV
jgi:putative SOS response-associated peptidase YedK